MSSLSINSNLESNDSSAYNFVRPPILPSVKDLETDLSLYRDLFKINDSSIQDLFGIHDANDR